MIVGFAFIKQLPTYRTFPSQFSALLYKAVFSNTLDEMSVKLSGSVTFARLVQPSNAVAPMLVTPSGIVMLVRLEQPANAELPMLVTLLGIDTLVRLGQPANADCSICVIPVSISTLVIFVFEKTLTGIVPMLPLIMISASRLSQPAKAFVPNEITEWRSLLIVVKFVQF